MRRIRCSLLYVANRYEKRDQIEQWLQADAVVVCDRYMASSIAYGEAQGLDPAWLAEIQRFLPRPDLTVLLDIAPETAAARKAANRDRYERDLALLSRVRDSYRRQAAAGGWLHLDGARPKDVVSRDVVSAVATRLSPR
jgi:dTMP kinase